MARLSRPRSRWPPGSLAAAPRPGGRRHRWDATDGCGQERLGRVTRALATRTAAMPAHELHRARARRASQARAQTVKLVSNSSATGSATTSTVDDDVTQTQQFTTGSHPTGYSLNAVILDGSLSNPMATLLVSIYEDSSGDPGNNIATLSGGTGVTQGLTNTFTAPQGTILALKTKYFVFIEGTSSSPASLRPTSGNGEDTNSADGWSIADSRRFRTTDGGAWRNDSQRAAPDAAWHADHATHHHGYGGDL